MENKKSDKFANIKILALIIFGMAGVYFLIYLIRLALAQDLLIYKILLGIGAVLLAPLVNTVTGFFDGSVETNLGGAFKYYIKVLVSLVMQLLFIVLMFPFIGIYLGAVLGAMGIIVCIVFFGIYLIQNVIGWNIGAAPDIGVQLGTVGLIFLGLVVYEGLFCLGYYIYNRYQEKIWDFLRKIFNR